MEDIDPLNQAEVDYSLSPGDPHFLFVLVISEVVVVLLFQNFDKL